MFLMRKIGGFLRGKATPGQVIAASALGGALGFVPGFFLPSDIGGGFLQAPGLILALLLSALVFQVNLGVFSLVTLLAKAVSLPLLPASFALGRALLDGPLQPAFRWLVNAPVTAWFGLERYATTGGLMLGLFFGMGVGLLLARALHGFRTRMAQLEAGSAAYQKYAGRLPVRFFAWLLFAGGKGRKLTWQELAANDRRTSPVRAVGAALAAALVASLWVFQAGFSQGLMTRGVQGGLQALNGATVDLNAVRLDLQDGTLRIDGLAMADADALDRDVFAARTLEAAVDVGQLLRRRLSIATVRAADAKSGTPRQQPGQRNVTPPPEPEPPTTGPGTSIEDYLADFETYRRKFEEVRPWLERLFGPRPEDPAAETPSEREERVAEQAQDLGLVHVVAQGLRDEAPALHIQRIDLAGIACESAPGGSLDLVLDDWSTAPWLLPNPPTVHVRTGDDSMALDLSGGSGRAAGAEVRLSAKGLAVDRVFAAIRSRGQKPVQGGTLDAEVQGKLTYDADGLPRVDLPVTVTLADTTFLFSGKPTRIERLEVPLAVRGPLGRPRVQIEDKALQDALLAAGKRELADYVLQQQGKLLSGVPALEGVLDPSKTPEQMLDAAKQKAEEAARKAAEDAAKKAAEEAAKKGFGDALKGLLPGGKKKS